MASRVRNRTKAEEAADRVLAALRPQLVRVLAQLLSQGSGPSGPSGSNEAAQLTEQDLAEAEAVAARWGAAKKRRG